MLPPPTAPLRKLLSNCTVNSMAPLPPHAAVDDGMEEAAVVVEAVAAVVIADTFPLEVELVHLSTLLHINRLISPTRPLQPMQPVHLDQRFRPCGEWVPPLQWQVHHGLLTRTMLALAFLPPSLNPVSVYVGPSTVHPRCLPS